MRACGRCALGLLGCVLAVPVRALRHRRLLHHRGPHTRLGCSVLGAAACDAPRAPCCDAARWSLVSAPCHFRRLRALRLPVFLHRLDWLHQCRYSHSAAIARYGVGHARRVRARKEASTRRRGAGACSCPGRNLPYRDARRPVEPGASCCGALSTALPLRFTSCTQNVSCSCGEPS